ncbi:MAG TPA: glycosyltransferase, partial [Candidatus Dojkabacteria bacterium]|nr:glycosyltransferase [Candidatus Dojkabacteria bacterium]
MKVSITIPTYNRSQYISQAIESAINQSYKDIEIIVIDNCSTDNTEELVNHFQDKGVKYIKNHTNIGMMGNWNRCIEVSTGELLMILGDDDILYPNFIEESVSIFEKHPNIGFTFTHINKVDKDGKPLTKWGYKFTPAGLIKGRDYLLDTAKYSSCLTNSSSVLINKEVFKKIGIFEAPLSQNTFDFNMWIKIANSYDVYFIDKVLSDYRIHEEQVSEIHWRDKKRHTGKLGTYIELFQLASYLLKKKEIRRDEKDYESIINQIAI